MDQSLTQELDQEYLSGREEQSLNTLTYSDNTPVRKTFYLVALSHEVFQALGGYHYLPFFDIIHLPEIPFSLLALELAELEMLESFGAPYLFAWDGLMLALTLHLGESACLLCSLLNPRTF